MILSRNIISTLLFVLTIQNCFSQDVFQETLDSVDNSYKSNRPNLSPLSRYYNFPLDDTVEINNFFLQFEDDLSNLKKGTRSYYTLLNFGARKALYLSHYKKTITYISMADDEGIINHYDLHYGIKQKLAAYAWRTKDYSLQHQTELEAYEIAKKTNDDGYLTPVLINLSSYELEHNNLDKAEHYLEQINKSALNHVKYKHFYNSNQGRIQIKRENYEDALGYLNIALETSRNSRDSATTFINFCAVYTKLHSFVKAEHYGTFANILAKKNHNKYLIESSARHLSIVYEEIGKHEEALKNLSESAKINEESNAIDIQIETEKYKKKKNEKVIESIKNDSKKTASILSNQVQIEKKWKVIFLIFLILITLFSIIIYVNYRRKIQLVKNQFIPKETEENVKNVIQKNNEEPKSVVTINENLKIKLEKKLLEEKVYTNPNLSLARLAKDLETNTSELSSLINNAYNQKFRDLINYYRVKEAKKLLSNKKNNLLTIEAIGEMAGYSNLSTFNKNFKSIVGTTPSFFKKQSQKRDLVSM